MHAGHVRLKIKSTKDALETSRPRALTFPTLQKRLRAETTALNTCTVTRARSRALAQHSHTCSESCSIDNLTYFLPTVISLPNCLKSASPGNSRLQVLYFQARTKSARPGAAPAFLSPPIGRLVYSSSE